MRITLKRTAARLPNPKPTATPAQLHDRRELDSDKSYLTVPELASKVEAAETEIMSAIRFGALEVKSFPVRGALRFRIEEKIAQAFARRFYARHI